MTLAIECGKKTCGFCGATFERKRYGTRLEDRLVFLRRKYCSLRCANSTNDPTRAGYQIRTRKFRKKRCEQCGVTHHLGVHHKDRNWKNNDEINLQTLCNVCHTSLHWNEDPSFNGRTRAMCSVCDKRSYVKPYCLKHHQRFKKYGDPFLTRKIGGCKSSPVIRVSD